MRKLATSFTAIALVAAPLALAQAQGTTPAAPPVTGTTTAPAEMNAATTGFIREQAPGQHLADSIIGAKVYSAEGKQSGEVADLLLDADGRLTGAVVSFGGFLGIGEKMVAVPWDRLSEQSAQQGGGYSLPMSEEEMKAAPPFTSLANAAQDATRTMPGAGTAPMPAPAPAAPAQ